MNVYGSAATKIRMAKKCKRINIHFVTSLEEESIRMMGFLPCTAEEAIELTRLENGDVAWV